MSDNPFKILIVDDEPDICDAIESFLSKRGYIVFSATCGKEALGQIEIIKPDAILLDFTLPDINGKEVLSLLRARDKTTKVIIVTGEFLTDDGIDKIKALGVSGYFQKPVLLEDLGQAINDILGSYPSEFVIRKTKRTSFAKSNPTQRATIHELKNILGIIRNKCENFTLNVQDGIYKDKSEKEINNTALETMNAVIETVDRAVDIIEKIPRTCEGDDQT